MKNIAFLTILMGFVLVSCNQRAKEKTNNHSNHLTNDNMMMDNDSTMKHNKSNTLKTHAKMYACPMHLEVTGKRDEKCAKCGMKLTELVLEKKEESKSIVS